MSSLLELLDACSGVDDALMAAPDALDVPATGDVAAVRVTPELPAAASALAREPDPDTVLALRCTPGRDAGTVPELGKLCRKAVYDKANGERGVLLE